jgi:hypothetical protein
MIDSPKLSIIGTDVNLLLLSGTSVYNQAVVIIQATGAGRPRFYSSETWPTDQKEHPEVTYDSQI